MKSLSFVAVILGGLLVFTTALADQDADQDVISAQEFLDSMTFHQGAVQLPGGIAALEIPDNFRYIDSKDSQRLLEEGWGNPDGSGQIGMLLPTDSDLFGETGWAVVISYQEDGYVSDKEANQINYNEIMQSMQSAVRENNKHRSEQGYPPLTLVGWATPPHYDHESKKLYWAKELKFGEEENHTLNYNVRILGRKGVLVMNAVSSMEQLPMIQERMERVIDMAEFNQGYRYSDFDPGMDKVAAYGLAALIGGKIAAKAGLLAKLGGLLLAFKKLIIIAGAALFGFFAKLFKKTKTEMSA